MLPKRPERDALRRLEDRHGPLRRTVWAVLLYLSAGLLWITFSDRLAEAWFPDPATLSVVQTWKGYFFVLVTGLVLAVGLHRQLRSDRVRLRLQLRQREALWRRERQLTVLMDNLPGMAYRCLNDEHWTMLFVSGGCVELTGYQPEELIHNRVKSFAELIEDEAKKQIAAQVEEASDHNESFSLEYPIRRKDGHSIWVWERGCAVSDDDGGTVLEGIILDISDRKALEIEMAELATRDPLTGLINRREFTRIMEEEMARCDRYDRPMALLWVDFDHFKDVNDTWGHAAGDTVLCSVSRTLRDSVRSVDSVGRFGGEEFAILLPEMAREEARETAERLRQRVRRTPISLNPSHDIYLTISIGIALYPEHGGDADSLGIAADKAMYLAKRQGRDRVVEAGAPEAARSRKPG